MRTVEDRIIQIDDDSVDRRRAGDHRDPHADDRTGDREVTQDGLGLHEEEAVGDRAELGERGDGRAVLAEPHDDLALGPVSVDDDLLLVDEDGLGIGAGLDQDGGAVLGCRDRFGDRLVVAAAVLGDDDRARGGEIGRAGDDSAGGQDGHQQGRSDQRRDARRRRTDGHAR